MSYAQVIYMRNALTLRAAIVNATSNREKQMARASLVRLLAKMLGKRG